MAALGKKGHAGGVSSPARRRSATGSEEVSVPAVKHSIVLKKIKPQKNLPPGTSTAPRRSPRVHAEAVKENVCQVSPGSGLRLSPLPRCPSPPPPPPRTPKCCRAARDPVMSQKVRRSYSRLSPFGTQADNASDGSDTSTPNQWHPARRSFFGFERLLAVEAMPDFSPVKPVNLRENPPAPPVSPGAIPGVAAAKKKKKPKRKVAEIEKSVLDEWAAQMNATFEEAERFDLVVE
ncbi:LOW QUALITY PROTEIN: sororin [Hemitrygon akajei]|uniref:LOW QUALITY PROTEIN: sororin n=1 Tax=Hemitrygon akajei TaxID=2704970 RepID=UPI003BF9BBAA